MDESRESAPEERRWLEVARSEELPAEGEGLTVELGEHNLALFRQGEGVCAMDDACPHEGASLGMGVVLDGEITCPWHAWHFRLSDGANTDTLDCRVAVHPARIQGSGAVEVLLPASWTVGRPT